MTSRAGGAMASRAGRSGRGLMRSSIDAEGCSEGGLVGMGRVVDESVKGGMGDRTGA
jgi:hypothetical protein